MNRRRPKSTFWTYHRTNQSTMVLSSYITTLYFVSVVLYFVTCLMSIPEKCNSCNVVRNTELDR